jgi:hypothetical protein
MSHPNSLNVIFILEGEFLARLPHGTNMWRALVNTAMNLRPPKGVAERKLGSQEGFCSVSYKVGWLVS